MTNTVTWSSVAGPMTATRYCCIVIHVSLFINHTTVHLLYIGTLHTRANIACSYMCFRHTLHSTNTAPPPIWYVCTRSNTHHRTQPCTTHSLGRIQWTSGTLYVWLHITQIKYGTTFVRCVRMIDQGSSAISRGPGASSKIKYSYPSTGTTAGPTGPSSVS